MTNNIAKIRAALVMCDCPVCDEALAALAELEKAAAPQFVAGELSDTTARKLWREWFDASGITGVESAHFWLKALRRELGPALGLVELREPTPEECERIYSFWLSAEGCNGRTPGERMGGLMSIAVRAVMWPKSEAK